MMRLDFGFSRHPITHAPIKRSGLCGFSVVHNEPFGSLNNTQTEWYRTRAKAQKRLDELPDEARWVHPQMKAAQGKEPIALCEIESEKLCKIILNYSPTFWV